MRPSTMWSSLLLVAAMSTGPLLGGCGSDSGEETGTQSGASSVASGDKAPARAPASSPRGAAAPTGTNEDEAASDDGTQDQVPAGNGEGSRRSDRQAEARAD